MIPDPQYSTALSVTPWLAAPAAVQGRDLGGRSGIGRRDPAFADDGTIDGSGDVTGDWVDGLALTRITLGGPHVDEFGASGCPSPLRSDCALPLRTLAGWAATKSPGAGVGSLPGCGRQTGGYPGGEAAIEHPDLDRVRHRSTATTNAPPPATLRRRRRRPTNPGVRRCPRIACSKTASGGNGCRPPAPAVRTRSASRSTQTAPGIWPRLVLRPAGWSAQGPADVSHHRLLRRVERARQLRRRDQHGWSTAHRQTRVRRVGTDQNSSPALPRESADDGDGGDRAPRRRPPARPRHCRLHREPAPCRRSTT